MTKSASFKCAVLLCLASLVLWSCSRKASSLPRNGATLFAVNCALCHGAEGKGDGMAAASIKPPPPRLDSAFLASRSRSDLESALRRGVTRDGRQTMPPASELTEAEVTLLADYLFVLAKENEARK